MVDYQMTNRVTNHGLPGSTAEGIKAEAYFLLKCMRKVSGEFALMAAGYNLSRVENMF